MGGLARVKQRFIVILVIFAIVDVALLAYRFWPGSSVSDKLLQEQALKQQADALSHEVAPLQGIGEQLAKTRVDVQKFYDQKVPTEFSEISRHLEKLVQETGVTTQGIHYGQDRADKADKSDLPDVQRISVDTAVSGEYSKVARFINALEQDKYVFIITQIALNSQEAGGVVSLQIKFETFLKEA